MVGQVEAKWACEVAAAGRHHMLFHGPPGVGKTMLAERVPTLLPDLDLRDALEVSAVHSLAGFRLDDRLVTRPPYSDPHHSASVVSMVGGGPRLARPGAISIAHKGVLFLDEAPEFPPAGDRRTAYAVGVRCGPAQPQRGRGALSRGLPVDHGREPVPVRTGGDPRRPCQCAPQVIRRYAERISGPIRDRIDITQGFLPMRKAFLKAALQRRSRPSAVAERVAEARQRQRRRLAGTGWQTNGEVAGSYLRKHLPMPDLQAVNEAYDRGRLSARGVDKVLRLMWTVADLAGRDIPGPDDVAIALAMRRGEQSGTVVREVG